MERASIGYLNLPGVSRMDRVADRQARRATRVWRKRLILLLLFLGLLVGLWQGGMYLLGKTFFAINEVHIQGTAYLSQDEVKQCLDGVNLDTFFSVDTDTVKEKLAQQPYVKDVVLQKVYPNRLVIQIEERLPVAYFLQGRQLLALSEDGALLPVDSRLGASAMPILSAKPKWEGTPSMATDEATTSMTRILGILKTELPNLYAEIDYADANNMTFSLSDGAKVILDKDTEFEDLARLVSLRILLAQDNQKASSFDLRYEDQVVVKGVLTTAPTPEAPMATSLENEILPDLAPPVTEAKKEVKSTSPQVKADKTSEKKSAKPVAKTSSGASKETTKKTTLKRPGNKKTETKTTEKPKTEKKEASKPENTVNNTKKAGR